MKRIYPYDDSKTTISTINLVSRTHNRVQIETVDEITGIEIYMVKNIKEGDFADEESDKIFDPRTNS